MSQRRKRDRAKTHRAAGRWVLAVVLAFAGICLAAASAAAMTFTCIESSKYKHIAKLFGDDPRRLAEALGIGVRRLPPPEACRAALATGGTERGDPERLAGLIIADRGWLDTLYLNSPGGPVGPANATAFLVRDFWLNTKVMRSTGRFLFPPAEVGVVGETREDSAMAAFAADVEGTETATKPGAWCASACTFVFAAGVSREGVANVHRCRSKGKTIQAESESVDRCLDVSMRRLYEKMGTGDNFIDAALTTTTVTTTPVTMPRFASTVEDALLQRCKSDGAQLDDLKALLDYDLRRDGSLTEFGVPKDLNEALGRVEARRQATETCIRQAHERDRLAAYDRLCGRGCTVRTLHDAVDAQLEDLAK